MTVFIGSLPKGRHIDVLTTGETMVSLVPREGRLTDADTFRGSIAGAESNVGAHLARFGRHVEWAGLVGGDPLGERVLEAIHASGVGTRFAKRVPGARTGVMFKDPVGDGRAVFYYRADSAAAGMADTDVAGLSSAGASVIHLTGVTAALSESCLNAVSLLLDDNAGPSCLTSFDVNYREPLWESVEKAAEVLRDLAERADLVFVGQDEARLLWGCRTPEAVRATLDASQTLVVKDGSRGATAFVRAVDGRQATAFVPSPVVEVRDAVGAGDAFAAGYLHAWLSGSDIATCLDVAHGAAATVLGSVLDIPEVSR